MEPRTRRRVAALGLLFASISPPSFFRTCADHCAREGVSVGGVEIVRFVGVSITYCDSGSTCTAGLGPVFLIVGLSLLGLVLVR